MKSTDVRHYTISGLSFSSLSQDPDDEQMERAVIRFLSTLRNTGWLNLRAIDRAHASMIKLEARMRSLGISVPAENLWGSDADHVNEAIESLPDTGMTSMEYMTRTGVISSWLLSEATGRVFSVHDKNYGDVVADNLRRNKRPTDILVRDPMVNCYVLRTPGCHIAQTVDLVIMDAKLELPSHEADFIKKVPPYFVFYWRGETPLNRDLKILRRTSSGVGAAKINVCLAVDRDKDGFQ